MSSSLAGPLAIGANRPDTHWLDKEQTIAPAGFNRWLVPPCALAIHLCIGMAYGFSVFWLPLSRALGVKQPLACPAGTGFFTEMFVSDCDWKISTLGWMYTLFFVFLGCSAVLWGGWLERAGPRKAGVVSALCWCGARRPPAPVQDAAAGLRRDRRHRSGAGLHLAGEHAHRVVPRPARHGHHGLRRPAASCCSWPRSASS